MTSRRKSVVFFSGLALLALGACGLTLPTAYRRRQIEDAVGGGARLPANTPLLSTFKYHQLGGNSFRLFVRFEGTTDTFNELVSGFGLSVFGAGPPAPCLPHAWAGPETEDLNWWTASTHTPRGLAGSRRLRTGSWVTAKYESGFLFMVIVVNQPEAVNGPF